MCIKHLNNRAFSLLEILLAAIILIISIAGIYVTSNSIRTPVINKENALAAALFGKQVNEALYSQVSGDLTSTYYQCTQFDANNNCTDFSLYPGNHAVTTSGANWPGNLVWPSALISSNQGGCISGIPANSGCLIYTVSCADGSTSASVPPCVQDYNTARIANLSINWPSIP